MSPSWLLWCPGVFTWSLAQRFAATGSLLYSSAWVKKELDPGTAGSVLALLLESENSTQELMPVQPSLSSHAHHIL